MRMIRLAAALLALAGCQADSPDRPVSSDMPVPPRAPFAPTRDCPILGSSDWSAFIDDMPDPSKRPMLTISGKVRVPSGGYRARFLDMRVAESYPVQIFLDLAVTPPSGPATQAITTIDVGGEFPVPPPVGSVTIRCGGQVIGVINEIVVAL
jgi:hypothetical protein